MSNPVILKEHHVVSVIKTMFDNEQIFRLLESLKKQMPGEIVVWCDLCGDEFVKRVSKEVDHVISTNSIWGVIHPLSFFFFALNTKFLAVFSDDYILPDSWWAYVDGIMLDETVASCGEVYENWQSLPDGPIVFRRKAVVEVGASSFRYGMHGHSLNELQNRMLTKGWKIICMQTGVKHLGHKTVDKLKEMLGESAIKKDWENNLAIWKQKTLNPNEEWWK